MTANAQAYNSVRFRTKPGREREFIEAHRQAHIHAPGFLDGALIRTGENSFCFIGAWKDMDSLAGARPDMIRVLDTFRDMLEELPTGVTDPVSGEVVARLMG